MSAKDDAESRIDDLRNHYAPSFFVELGMRNTPRSTEEFIEILYKDLFRIVSELEGTANLLKGEGEEKLRTRIVQMLRQKGYNASAEVDNKGHVDLLVRSEYLDLSWLAEAKVHGAYDELVKGMEQLLNRYSTGRHEDLMLLVFVFDENTLLILERWIERMSKDKVCDMIDAPEKHATNKLAFWSRHTHRGSGLPLRTCHVFVNLYHAPTDSLPKPPKLKIKKSKKGQTPPPARS